MYMVSLIFGVVLAVLDMPPGTTMPACNDVAALVQIGLNEELLAEPYVFAGSRVRPGDIEVVCSYTKPVQGRPMTKGTPA